MDNNCKIDAYLWSFPDLPHWKRLSYLRGRLFEQKDKEELQQAYNIALEVNNELRAKLGIKLEKDGLINPGSELK